MKMQSKLWIWITNFFFALEEPSNQVTKKLLFRKEKERRSKLALWNMLGNGVLLDRLWRDLLQIFGENEESS
jgi:hypothetical protein